MLVLTRKTGEQLIIADNIRITVVSVGPGRVKIGIDAPSTVKIDRQEIYDKKVNETQSALEIDAGEANADQPIVLSSKSAHSTANPLSQPTRSTDSREPSEGPDRLHNRIRRVSHYRSKPR